MEELPHIVVKKLERLGQRVKHARLTRDWKRKDFADSAGVSVSTLKRIEEGDPRVGIWAYSQALYVCGMISDLDLILCPRADLAGLTSINRIRATGHIDCEMRELDKL